MLDWAKAIHQAIGIESPRAFIAVFALLGFLLFGAAAWIVDHGYRVKLKEESAAAATAPASSNASGATSSITKKDAATTTPQTSTATTSGANSPANTGNGNNFSYQESSPAKKGAVQPKKGGGP